MKYKLTLAYDGTRFCGFQVQNNGLSIQSLIEEALGVILREPTPIVAAGRTDAGVHARGQVAHFSTQVPCDPRKLFFSLNGILPQDIRVLSIDPASDDFHARYSAVSKVYHYHVHLGAVITPFKMLYATHVRHEIDCLLLQEAAQLFLGKKDFTSFAHAAMRGATAKNPYRTLYRLDCVAEEGGFRLEFEADGFLYKMVRNITGMLLAVGANKRSIEQIPEIFSAKDRRRAAPTAPPQGLFLVKVNYSSIIRK